MDTDAGLLIGLIIWVLFVAVCVMSLKSLLTCVLLFIGTAYAFVALFTSSCVWYVLSRIVIHSLLFSVIAYEIDYALLVSALR